MTKSRKLVKKNHKNLNLSEKMSLHSVKKDKKNVNLSDKKSQTSAEKSQKCKSK